jgi:phenylpropionate dioxygenase-like ring-hydroxylating dioxygenase large terminal subunit
VPGQKQYYRDQLDKSRFGLAKAAQVDLCHGFIFATLAADAPPLLEYLGDVGRTGLGLVAAHGDVIVLDGIQKNVVGCNWKVAVDNLFDWYHVMYSHASANSSGVTDLSKILYPNQQFVMLGEYGHAISGPGLTKEQQDKIDAMSDAEREELSRSMPPSSHRVRPASAKELMGPSGVRSTGHPNIFPNLWITLGGLQMCLRLPRGPGATELWWFTIVPKAASPEFRKAAQRMAVHLFGPAGLLEQDDGENWSQSTRSAQGLASRALGQTIQMGLGQDEVARDNSGQRYIETSINEHGQRWLYRAWTEWMAARDWADLKTSRSPAPAGRV